MRFKQVYLTAIVSLSQLIVAASIQAQPIIPAADGTNTQVTSDSNNPGQFNITGGTLSPDNLNLFHSFEKFNLSFDQIATFLSNPGIQNILGRIVGGDVSIINGRIQLENGTANLFLMNPAGFIFGNNASLHIPGDFTVTTANGIQFGENWFNAIGVNNYDLLTGNPTGFAFTMTQPGGIINAATLTVDEEQNITFLGGKIVNTASINTPQGEVNITAVPGERFVRISLPGQLLSLEVEALPNTENLPNSWNIPILALPELLTVGNSDGIIDININEDGSLQLPNSETAVSVNSGDIITADINIETNNSNDAGSIQINAANGNITTGSLNTASTVRDVNSSSSIQAGNGGSVNLSADGDITITGSLNTASTVRDVNSSSSIQSGNGGSVNLSADGDITITGSLNTASTVRDVNSSSSIQAGSGGTANLSANGNITINGDVTTNSSASLGENSDSNLTINSSSAGEINIDAVDSLEINGNINAKSEANGGNIISRSNVTSGTGGNVNLTANNQINILGEINAESITTSTAGNNDTSLIGGEITLEAQNINIGDVNLANTDSENINLIVTRNRNINLNGAVTLNQDTEIRLKGNDGDLTISDNLNGTARGLQALDIVFNQGEGEGTVIFNGIGNVAPLENLDIQTAGNIELAGNFFFIDEPTFSNPIILIGETSITSEQSLSFTNTVTTEIHNLTLITDEVNFSLPIIGNNNSLSIQNLTPNVGIELGGETNPQQLNLTQFELDQIQGFETVTIGDPVNNEVLQVGTENTVNLQNSDFSLTLGGNNINFVNGVLLPDDSILTINAATVNRGTNNLDIEIGGENSHLILNNSETFGQSENPIQTSVSQLEIQNNEGEIFLDNNRALNFTTSNSTTGNLSLSTMGDLTATNNILMNDIELNATGNITTEEIRLQSSNAQNNNILLNSGGSVNTGDLLITGNTGGNVTIQAETSITTQQINTSATLGNGGSVILDAVGDIQVESINTQAGNNGIGGEVSVNSNNGFFRATGTFRDQNNSNASISTAGGLGGGNITIRHAGGPLFPPVASFEVGNASLNGTAGSITSGTFEFSPNASFPNSITEGNLAILTDDADVSPPPDTTPLGEPITVENEDLESPLFEEPLQPSIAEKPVCAPSSAPLPAAETTFTKEFESYLNIDAPTAPSLSETCEILSRAAEIAGIKPAVIYGQFVDNQLQLVLVTQAGKFIARLPEGAKSEVMKGVARRFERTIRQGSRRISQELLADAEQLYQWLVEPLENELQRQQIDHLVFILDEHLRTLPLAALYDGEQFLIEHYSVGMMPSLSLTDTRPTNLRNTQVLAMGTSEFSVEQSQEQLIFSPYEIRAIEQVPENPWQPQILFGNEFTRQNLQQQQSRFRLIHLSTHANFSTGSADNTYIQLYDSKLDLSAARRLEWDNVKLLVLSACQTAIGDTEAELGFAGLAFQTGVKSVVASLWSVEEGGTLPLIQGFYQQLANVSTQAEALRRAQLAMLNKEFERDDFPAEIINLGHFEQSLENINHPFYWAAFTIVGSPW